MKNLLILGVLFIAGCAAAKAAPVPGESASAIAISYELHRDKAVTPVNPVPSVRCNGTKYITHGDGHRTPCPGCQDCKKSVSLIQGDELLIQPAVYTKAVKKTVKKSIAKQQVAAGACACTESGACECTPAAACEDGSCDAGSSGSCATGACGVSEAGPVRRFVGAKPVRRAFGAIRQGRPLRRVFGRVFCRGCN